MRKIRDGLYTLDYTSPFVNVIMERESGASALTYRYTYGLKKNSVAVTGASGSTVKLYYQLSTSTELQGVGKLAKIGALLNIYDSLEWMHKAIFTQNYLINEAIYYHFDYSVWTSKSHDSVVTKFKYAKGEIVKYLSLGVIGIKKASEMFDFGSSNSIYRYDPFSGEYRFFYKDTHYFVLLNDDCEGKLADIENAIIMKAG